MGTQYNIKWNNFNLHTGDSFKDLCSEPDFLDVTLVSEDDMTVPAHKLILASSSDFFKKKLLRDYQSRPVLILDGVYYEELAAIKDFIYTGSADVDKDRLQEFLRVGRKFKVKGLIENENKFFRFN